MRIKKIRGHKRIWKNIEKWKLNNLNLDIENLKTYERFYTKIWVVPFSRLSLVNSKISDPKTKTKAKIIESLLDIYDNWKTQLDKLNEPYYLKIWLYEPHLLKSQVVCAIGNYKNSYENTFEKPQQTKLFSSKNFNTLKPRIDSFNWKHRLDEYYLDNTDIGLPEDFKTEKDYLENKDWFNKQLQKPHRKILLKKPIDNTTEAYAFKIGDVWLGEIKTK